MADNSLTPKEEFLLNPVTEHNITDAAIATFETNLRHPVKVEVPLAPIQDLHGMDSPYPAGASVNLIPDTTNTENGYVAGSWLKSDGSIGADANYYISEYIELNSANTYTWSDRVNTNINPSICFYDENKDYISGIAINNQYSHTFTPPEGAVYCRSSQTTYAYQKQYPSGPAYQLEVGSTATPYKRYSNICPIDYIDNVTINGRNKNFMVLDRPYRIGGLAYGSDVGSSFGPEITSEGRYVFENDIATLSNNTGWRGVAIASQPLKKGMYHLHYTIMSVTHSTSTMSDAQDIVLIDENYKILSKYDHVATVHAGTRNYNINVPEDGCRICINYGGRSSTYLTIKLTNVQLELGTAYTEYQRPKLTSIPITFTDPSTGNPMTVYGGTVTLNEDGSADLVSKWQYVLLKNLQWTYYSPNAYFRTEVLNDAAPGMNNVNNNVVKSSVYKTFASNGWREHGSINVATNSRICVMHRKYTTVSAFISAMGETQIIYKLKTPQTYHFPNVGQLKAFLGTNNIWSDVGNVNVKYLTQNTETGMEYRGDRALELRRRAMIADAPTIHTTVGSSETNGLASFKSYVKAPVKSVTIPFSPKQDLHGYDHPWPGGSGVNLFDPSRAFNNKRLNNVGEVINYSSYCVSDWIPCEPNTNYYANYVIPSANGYAFCFYDANKHFLRYAVVSDGGSTIKNSGANAVYLRTTVSLANKSKAMLAKSSSAVAFSPYENLCPIEGWTGCNLIQRGQNLVDGTVVKDIIFNSVATYGRGESPSGWVWFQPKQNDGYPTIFGVNATDIKNKYKFKENTAYTICFTSSCQYTGDLNIGYTYTDGSYIIITQNTTSPNTHRIVTDGSKTLKNIWIGNNTSGWTSINYTTFCVCEGDVALEDIPVQQSAIVPIAFTDPTTGDPMTIYGGTVTLNEDGSADVVSKMRRSVLTGAENWSSQAANKTYNQKYIVTLSLMGSRSLALNSSGKTSYIKTISTDNDYKKNGPLCAIFGWSDNKLYIMNADQHLQGVSDLASFKEYLSMNNLEILYPLASPISYHFSNLEQLKTFLGENNFWCDISDDITVKYWNRGFGN